MSYTVQLDISHEATVEEVAQFANEHGCYIRSVETNGPAGGNPLYEFASDSFDMVQELTEQILGDGHGFDEQEIKTMIVEV